MSYVQIRFVAAVLAVGVLWSVPARAQSLEDTQFNAVQGPRALKFMAGKPLDPISKAQIQQNLGSGPLTDIAASAEQLVSAVQARNGRVLRELLSQGKNPDARTLAGVTPLTAAIELGEVDLVRALLGAGANPSQAGLHGHTPLNLAIVNGHPEIVHRLLKAGADPNRMSRDGFRSLDLSAALNRSSFVQPLVLAGAILDNPSKRGTPLTLCATMNSTATCIALLRQGADPNITNRELQSPIFFATQNQNKPLAQALLAAGADAGAISMGWLD